MNEFLDLKPTLDLISFRRMVTPIIIQVIFWIGVVVLVIYGFSTVIEGVNGGSAAHRLSQMQFNQFNFGQPAAAPASGNADAGEVFQGILIIFFGPVCWRVYCELLIVIFRIHSELVDMNKKIPAAIKTP
jgi:hypothetical protein